MTEKLREQISALVDGELDEGEARLLVRRFEKDPELRRVWDSYQRCGQLLEVGDSSRERFACLDRNFSEAIMKAIADEEMVPETGGWWRDWLRPVAGIAVAAGVATVALVGLQGGNFDDAPESVEVVPGSSVESRPWSTSARFSPASAGTTRDVDESDSWQRLNDYRLNHTDRAAGLQRIEQDVEAEDESPEHLQDTNERGEPE